MTTLVKALPVFALVLLSAIPFWQHHSNQANHSTVTPATPATGLKPVALMKPDGRGTPDWDALEAAWQRDFDAQQAAAREAAARDAAAKQAAAAAAAPVVTAAARPAAAPAPVKQSYSGAIPDLIASVFAPLGQGAVDWAERVAMCESHDNPSAYNAATGASGLFQFMPGTWAHTPYASSSVFDASANARAAAWLYAQDNGSAWSCR
jgi:hypothetical protein